MESLRELLPTWADLVAALFLALGYTGTYAIVTDLQKALSMPLGSEDRDFVSSSLTRIQASRHTSLVAAGLFLVLYFMKFQMPVWGAIVVGLFWFSSQAELGASRARLNATEIQE